MSNIEYPIHPRRINVQHPIREKDGEKVISRQNQNISLKNSFIACQERISACLL